ncbi:hypothetical protein PSA7680_01408 [Pseudoruegeria aquimaris]|uniref:Uncharacterized protein n=1 Tax=Pseudoruegeria aquimaris TaxID=393663 RepID=A0A1Y5S0V7_9RHOB|nr:hypothetical protein [Pseudoruegeria aquimaris]SLN29929.1 hypothetical protein PSA7680_01408 [Pseudoruegeria aquimaris]
MRSLALMMVVSAGTALAQPAPGVREGDTLYGAADLAALLSGQAVTFFDGGTARYAADGSYSYAYEGSDQLWTGTWEAGEGSAVCVAFDNGFARCDIYVSDGSRLVLITEQGDRFPAQEKAPI